MTRRYTTTVCNIMARKDADRKGGGPRYKLERDAVGKPFIFVSCRQFTEAEKHLGNQIVQLVKEITGLEAFFAEDVQDLNGLDSNLLGALSECAAFITVMHPRGEIARA